ncbi:MAG: DUF4198 domain-containing protein [Bifidobacteriaceae bacterium]|jgi:hypothetical protein|nr:DUF4198 domain-containing protein [Bifidobacteriaceae bacterium]
MLRPALLSCFGSPISRQLSPGRLSRPRRNTPIALLARSGLALAIVLTGLAPVATASWAPAARADTPTDQTVDGRVVYADGKPAAGVTVSWDNYTCEAPRRDLRAPDRIGAATTGADGKFEFGSHTGDCYGLRLRLPASDVFEFYTADGEAPVARAFIASGAAGLIVDLVQRAPIPVTVAIPGFTPGPGSFAASFRAFRHTATSTGMVGWYGVGINQEKPAATFQTSLWPGFSYTFRYERDDVYYDQWSGGADATGSTSPPESIQTCVIPEAATAATCSVGLKRGTAVSGTVALDGERPLDVSVALVTRVQTSAGPAFLDVDAYWLFTDGRFAFSGLAPGRVYTLAANSAKHPKTWLGGVTGAQPDWSQLSGAAFAAPAAGTLSGQNLDLAAPAAAMRYMSSVFSSGRVATAAKVGSILTAGALAPQGWSSSYQWLRDGRAIKGAVARSYKAKAKDAGALLAVRFTATHAVTGARSLVSQGVAVAKITPTVKLKRLASGKLRATVKAKGLAKPVGKITIKFGSKHSATYKLTARLRGTLTKAVPKKVAAGTHKATATYRGSKQIAKKTSAKLSVTVR